MIISDKIHLNLENLENDGILFLILVVNASKQAKY